MLSVPDSGVLAVPDPGLLSVPDCGAKCRTYTCDAGTDATRMTEAFVESSTPVEVVNGSPGLASQFISPLVFGWSRRFGPSPCDARQPSLQHKATVL